MRRFGFVKIFIVLVIFFIPFFITSCGGGGGNGSNSPSGNGSNISSNHYSLSNGNHALMGPLEHASVKVYRLNDLSTSIANSTTNGLGTFSVDLPVSVLDDELLLVSVTGGKDIDANDDGIVDSNPTINKGTIHALVTAKELRDNKVNVTLLSEIVYQYVKDLIGNAHPDDIKTAIMTVSKKLFKTSIASNLSYLNNVLQFYPEKVDNRSELNFDYYNLIKDNNSLAKLYHDNANNAEIEKKLNIDFAGKLNLHDERLLENSKYIKISITPPLDSYLSSNGSKITYVPDNDSKEILSDYVPRGKKVTFTVTPGSGLKIIRWYGCDSVSSDLATCTVVANGNRVISPVTGFSNTILSPKVKDISNALVEIDNSSSATYIVSIDLNDNTTKAIVSTVKVGDIIFSNKNKYFVRKVTSVQKIDDYNYKFNTTFAPPNEVFQEGSLSIHKTYTPSDLNNKDVQVRFITPDRRVIKFDNISKYSKGNKFIFSFQNGNTIRGLGHTWPIDETLSDNNGDSINLSGSFSVEPTIDFDWSWKWFKLQYIRVVPKVKFEDNICITGIMSRSFEKEKDLGTLKFRQFFLMGTVPIEVTESINFKVGVDGEIHANVTINAHYTKVQSLGFAWSKGCGVTIINDAENSGNVNLPNINIGGSAEAYGRIIPAITVYGIGFDINNKIGVKAEFSLSLLNTILNYNIFGFYQPVIELKIPEFLDTIFGNIKQDIDNKMSNALNGLSFTYPLLRGKYKIGSTKPGVLTLVEGGNHNVNIYLSNGVSRAYSYTIANTGNESLNWRVDCRGSLCNYIQMEPDKGVLQPNDHETITINVAIPANISSNYINHYIANILFKQLSAPDNTIKQNLKINVVRKISPTIESPSIALEGNSIKNIVMHWQYDDISNIDGYIISVAPYNENSEQCSTIYSNIDTINNSSATEWSYHLYDLLNSNIVQAGKKYCFDIKAFKGEQESSGLNNPLILAIPHYAKLISSVRDQNGNPIPQANIRLTTLENTIISSATGDYTFENLIPGTYILTVTVNGYPPVIHHITLTDGETKNYQAQIVLSNSTATGNGSISGKILNAITGSGISNVTINIRKGGNNKNGAIVASVISDSSGNYTISLLQDGTTPLKNGTYTLEVSKDGYTTNWQTVVVIGDTTQDLSISPILPTNEVRIVLRWGQTPSDLDSHLVKIKDGVQIYHICYCNKNPSDADANLDRDDIDSYGPETITISSLDPNATYKYYVHDFSNRDNHQDIQLANSQATVEVYWGNRTYTFYVPNGIGNAWKVFEIVHGTLTPCTENCLFGVDGETDSQFGTRSTYTVPTTFDQKIFKNLPVK